MKISLICVGKLKEAYLKAAAEEYKKRLSVYAALEIIETTEQTAPEGLSAAERGILLAREAVDIEKRLRPGSYVITLEIGGVQLSSEELEERLSRLCVQGESDFTFIIGGSLGLHERLSNRARLRLSLSKMTFPHQLVRVILLEQIYRAFRIRNNEPYHK